MQISFLNTCSISKLNKTNNVKYNTNPIGMNKYKSQGDQFIKSKLVSFTGSNEGTKITDMNKVGEDLLAIGIGNAPLLLGIGAVIWTTKYEHGQDKYLADGSVVVDTKNKTIDSDKIIADGKTGAVKIEGTGIDLSQKRFDFVDKENGIYENSEKGIYIDLPCNKYVDPENGILVDPDAKITAVKIDGKYQEIIIPKIQYKGRQIPESLDQDKPNNCGDLYHYGNEDVPLTRDEHFKMFGEYPENDPHCLLNGKIIPDDNIADDSMTREEYFEVFGMYPEDDPVYAGNIKNDPDDQKSILENIKNLVNSQHHYRDDLNYDLWGREIIHVPGSNGQTHNIVMDDNLKEFTKEHELTGEELMGVAKYAHEEKMKWYLSDSSVGKRSENYSGSPMMHFLQKTREDIAISKSHDNKETSVPPTNETQYQDIKSISSDNNSVRNRNTNEEVDDPSIYYDPNLDYHHNVEPDDDGSDDGGLF